MINNPTNQPYFYVITNKINGRYYYGSGEKEGYEGSGKVLKRAYKKYGKESFEGKILRLFNTRKDAFNFEQRFLSLYKLDQDPVAYNVCRNANGGYISDKAYKKNSKFMKEYRQTKEGSMKGLKNTRADQTLYQFYNIDTSEYKNSTVYEMNKLTGAKASMFGYIVRGDRKTYKGWILAENIQKWGTRELLKNEHKKNIALSKIGKKNPKLSAAKKGVKLSKKHKLNISNGQTGLTYKKVTCPHCGKVGGINIMPRYHFDNCKQFKQL